MKLEILSIVAFLTSACAFAPNAAPAKTTALNGEKVPCFGATPLLGKEPIFIGENYWDKLTSEYGSAETGKYIRAAELKHGRAAMLGTVGYAFHKLGFTLNNISPHSFLSVTQGVQFEDLAAVNPVEAFAKIPAEGITQMFAAIAMVEIYELTHRQGKLVEDSRIAPGLEAGGLTGDIGWNPLGIEVTDRRRLSELQNGRAAMFCISAWIANDMYPGAYPLPLPW
mmetsp:Transcript_31140/g.35936  ORF Transcript_31140/g.35936 Transcript_31140/m.35936 type:complete len:225 (-) Transcript_31140:280-954(-)|eukprot:CAMPEP_0194381068 /NCGR_PEP_ID=MMETSP0174-20130528/50011_1 /TAXON_ID=216777 /ORGANISM="Proboscia alata, Strain PI-D3" /LENGTH=224 /DNA_ID=CAMNT_0039165047 /DNA_START=40 /DNA_END=714 /DNA_ORIENTATION=+